ncbi:hypothetical protein EKO27_g10983, partial [Xylaria grammica]
MLANQWAHFQLLRHVTPIYPTHPKYGRAPACSQISQDIHDSPEFIGKRKAIADAHNASREPPTALLGRDGVARGAGDGGADAEGAEAVLAYTLDIAQAPEPLLAREAAVPG